MMTETTNAAVESTATAAETTVAKATKPAAKKVAKKTNVKVAKAKAKAAPGERFSFIGKGWTASIAAGTGIALKESNRAKLLAHAIALKVGAPSDLKKLKQETLLAKVSKAFNAA